MPLNSLMPLNSPKSLSLLILMTFILGACGGLKTRQDLAANSGRVARDPRMPTPIDSQAKRPQPPKAIKLPKVGLILGPGGVKALAHTGVIREFEKSKIPIHSVVGLEWGALVGGLYAMKGKVHEAEWKLYKLKKSQFTGSSGIFSSGGPKTIKSLSGFLNKSLNGASIGSAKVRFACPSLSLWSGTVVWQKSGDMKKALERCLPYPPLFRPSSPWMAASYAVKEAAQYLMDKGAQLIVFVNVLDRGDLIKQNQVLKKSAAAILWHELRRHIKTQKGFAHEVIDVTTRQYKLYDFDDRQRIVKAGEQAGRRAASKIADKYGF